MRNLHPEKAKNSPLRNQPTESVAEREGPPTEGRVTRQTRGVSCFQLRLSDHCDEMMMAEGRAFLGKTKNGVCEIAKILRGRRRCSHVVAGSSLCGSSVPQNLGMGQKECPDRNILGPGQGSTEP